MLVEGCRCWNGTRPLCPPLVPSAGLTIQTVSLREGSMWHLKVVQVVLCHSEGRETGAGLLSVTDRNSGKNWHQFKFDIYNDLRRMWSGRVHAHFNRWNIMPTPWLNQMSMTNNWWCLYVRIKKSKQNVALTLGGYSLIPCTISWCCTRHLTPPQSQK